ncbi:hypothetical protein ACFYO6_39155 [Streptomyces anthocyanicus]|uniref:hypothetical protein n=1 Tax=Streptomyces anthocyanicus TaxID=68174 RepID=UPI00362FDD79
MRRDEEATENTPSRWAWLHAWETKWLLALVYAMLTDQRSEPLLDRARLRAADADALAAVDTAREPLDRAAARLMTKVPAVWCGEAKPRIDAYADAVEHDDRELSTWPEIDARHVVDRLVGQWRRTWEPTMRNASGVLWDAVMGWRDALLVDRHGGHAPGARARLGDGLLPWCTPWSGARTVRPSPTGCGSPAGTATWAAGCRPRRVTYWPTADRQE